MNEANTENIFKKSTEYIKYIDEENNIDCILKYKKMINKYGDDVYILHYHVSLVLLKENNIYKKVPERIISALKTHFDNNVESIDLEGEMGKNFLLENYKHINFRGKGLFSYFCSTILNDTIELLLNWNQHYIHFPDNSLVNSSEFERDTNNYLRRNRAYEKLGFRISYSSEDKMYGKLLDTPVEELRLYSQVPNSIKKYIYASDLIYDTLALLPFSKEIVEPCHNSFLNFVVEEKMFANASFDVTKVIGTNHPRYYSETWLSMLEKLRTPYIQYLLLKAEPNKKNINFFKQKRNYERGDDPWGIWVFDDKAYINEGNHRTVISRFLYELDLIDKDMTGLKYVKYFKIDYLQKRKFLAIKKWLKIYYPNYKLKIEVKSQVVSEFKNDNQTIKVNRIYYQIDNGQYMEKLDGKDELVTFVHNFDSIKDLQKHIRTLISQYRKESFVVVYQFIKQLIKYFVKYMHIKILFIKNQE